MSPLSHLARLRWPALLVALIALAACDATYQPPNVARPAYLVGNFHELSPAEIAILPIGGGKDFDAGDSEALYSEAYSVLLQKNYSPLAPEFVARSVPKDFRKGGPDAVPTIGELKAAIQTDAYLLVDVIRCDVAVVADHPRLQIHGRATMLSGDTGTVLFKYELPTSYDVVLDEEGRLDPVTEKTLIRRFAAQLLTGVPVRRQK